VIEVAVVGAGGWGKNLVRNYAQVPGANLRYICDSDERTRRALQPLYPHAQIVGDLAIVLQDPAVQAVVVATPGSTHHEICKRALLAGKHTYVEKPFVLSTQHAVELNKLADDGGLVLMVGHLLEYHPVVTRLRDMIASGELGRVYYLYSQRLNLGTIREDENALWNFAPHDISSILFMLGREPTDVAARGQSYLQSGVEDVAFLTLNFGGQAMAGIQVSWLDPHKTRKMTIVGSRKMAVFDDMETSEKLRIYDKGPQLKGDYDSFAEYVGLRFGDVTLPYIKMTEPLRIECLHFIDCVRERKRPLSDGIDGLRVVKVLEAAQESMRHGGIPVPIK
jgi:predicted dehydrogenase